MSGQPWLSASFGVFMIVTAVYCLARLAISWRRARSTDRQVDAMHVLMGVSMTGMLVPGLHTLWTGGWELIFAAAAVMFLWRVARAARSLRTRGASQHRPAHDLQHLLGCAAMLYALAATVPGGRAGGLRASGVRAGAMSGAAGSSTFALVMAVGVLACVVWTADRISAMAPVAALARMAPLASGGGYIASSPSPPDAFPVRPGRVERGRAVPLSQRLAACCEIAIGVTMGYMLIVLV